MRICHILETSGGGSGQIVLDLTESAIGMGDDVTVIYSPLRAEEAFVKALHTLQPGPEIFTLDIQRNVSLYDAVSVLRLLALLRRVGPFDIVHSHSSKAGAVARIAGLFMPRAKQVYTPHAFITMAPHVSPIYRVIEWILSGFSDVIICTSQQEWQHAREQLGISERKLRIVPNGVQLRYPANRQDARARMEARDEDYVVGFVGRLVPQKNPTRLIEAFAEAAASDPKLRLVIVGDGVLEGEVNQLISTQNLQTRVRFMGNCNGRDLMPGFDCLACSSDYESFGLVLLEALAAGVPVATTPVGVAPDVVQAGKTGCLADFSVQSLASGIVKLAACDSATRAEMAAQAKLQAQRFGVERMAQDTKAIYVEAVAETGGRLLKRVV